MFVGILRGRYTRLDDAIVHATASDSLAPRQSRQAVPPLRVGNSYNVDQEEGRPCDQGEDAEYGDEDPQESYI